VEVDADGCRLNVAKWHVLRRVNPALNSDDIFERMTESFLFKLNNYLMLLLKLDRGKHRYYK
jgi:hypothetical protein